MKVQHVAIRLGYPFIGPSVQNQLSFAMELYVSVWVMSINPFTTKRVQMSKEGSTPNAETMFILPLHLCPKRDMKPYIFDYA